MLMENTSEMERKVELLVFQCTFRMFISKYCPLIQINITGLWEDLEEREDLEGLARLKIMSFCVSKTF